MKSRMARRRISGWLSTLATTWALVVWAGGKHEEGGSQVKPQDDFAVELTKLDPDDERACERAASRIRGEALAKPKALLPFVHSPDAARRAVGRELTLRIGELALSPLLEGAPADDPTLMVWDLSLATEIQLENQARIVRRLEASLEDTRPVKTPVLPPKTEGRHPARRVRDEAYLLLRKLLAFEDIDAQQQNANEFLAHMTEEQRDREIKHFRTTRHFRTLMENVQEHPEFKK